jgi:hypothetical protein
LVQTARLTVAVPDVLATKTAVEHMTAPVTAIVAAPELASAGVDQ